MDESQKINQVVIGNRLTFSTAFAYANKHYSNQTVILANADIYFDNSLRTFGDFSTLDLKGEVLALLKWQDIGNSTLSLNIRTDSQDAWIFQPPLNPKVVELATFYLGTFSIAYLFSGKCFTLFYTW
jgi:hypothetical protein